MRQLKKVLSISVYAVMMIQIVLGIYWGIHNVTGIPSFGDTNEYLELSRTLLLDEYRPVLYPLILRFFTALGEITGIEYQIMLYLVQAMCSLAAILYCVNTILKFVYGSQMGKNRLWMTIFVSLYVWTIPMIQFMNFTVLTDSLANSALIVFLANAVIILFSEKVHIGVYFSMSLAFVMQSLLRADRIYSCLITTIVILLLRIIMHKKYRMQCLTAFLAVIICSVGMVKGVNLVTQTPGIHSRIQTSFAFVMLDRVVWPNMSANYEFFSDEIKNNITMEEAETFDSHNNNVMYQMAPLLEARVGHEKAEEYYLEMAKVVFEHQTKKVLLDIGEDISAMLCTPISSLLNAKKLCKKGDSWNITCMSNVTPELTKNYNLYYLYSFWYLGVTAILQNIRFSRKKKAGYTKKIFTALSPFITMSVILTLWFSVGDGAPPNDRYALIIYMTWSMGLVLFNILKMMKRKKS